MKRLLKLWPGLPGAGLGTTVYLLAEFRQLLNSSRPQFLLCKNVALTQALPYAMHCTPCARYPAGYSPAPKGLRKQWGTEWVLCESYKQGSSSFHLYQTSFLIPILQTGTQSLERHRIPESRSQSYEEVELG